MDEPNAIIIWEPRTGVKKRSFNADMHGAPHWPIFKWSHNDQYFGRMTKDGALSVYETPSFGLLDKKSIKVTGMRDFSWSPTENTLGNYFYFDLGYFDRCIREYILFTKCLILNWVNIYLQLTG